ncbi:MAG: hypothetical protein UR28_C0016G0005 [Candidatus Peregrinibacteria bacterium GW2011_GWF2_33_10]|nr:MAG: hypothetical protein UR28_C0016G0005 [Candidatus Peregrinibacteria bacterium GW2011_GWF2_33_10]OGJ45846.1 MAG: hypothetical protein A2263_03580 [Candidatus Peregrinibacteria bacterium RIFOXYA2_FULL_33_21]OGJ46485.1 MAG: hypothetical protein A2272_03535 [Candidatus Peregrinibacteria bacterium RIFOXYA12_FULL_33_12]OGJ51362.1 MAG: hypothetical protein A2307_02315 [Candidatus Peregrinibacteria bacterium RIFOXYB2_FULL_33_20]
MISSSTSLYFYSAFLQGNAALIGLIAIFIVYKKQYLDASFNNLEKIIINFLSERCGIAILYKNIFEYENYNEKFFQVREEAKISIKESMNSHVWHNIFDELKKINNQRETLWEKASLTIKLIFIILSASIISLPLSDLIHLNIYLEIMLFIIFVIAESYTLRLLFIFIKNQLSK